MNSPSKFGVSSGFSLVEMLVVIAVIGIMAAVAVPAIQDVNRGARESKDRRNAQQIASIFSAAEAAGRSFHKAPDDSLINNLSTIVDLVCDVDGDPTNNSINQDSSPFDGQYFGVPELNEDERRAAEVYLELEANNGMLQYKP